MVVHKPVGDVTTAMSIIYTDYDCKLILMPYLMDRLE